MDGMGWDWCGLDFASLASSSLRVKGVGKIFLGMGG